MHEQRGSCRSRSLQGPKGSAEGCERHPRSAAGRCESRGPPQGCLRRHTGDPRAPWHPRAPTRRGLQQQQPQPQRGPREGQQPQCSRRSSFGYGSSGSASQSHAAVQQWQAPGTGTFLERWCSCRRPGTERPRGRRPLPRPGQFWRRRLRAPDAEELFAKHEPESFGGDWWPITCSVPEFSPGWHERPRCAPECFSAAPPSGCRCRGCQWAQAFGPNQGDIRHPKSAYIGKPKPPQLDAACDPKLPHFPRWSKPFRGVALRRTASPPHPGSGGGRRGSRGGRGAGARWGRSWRLRRWGPREQQRGGGCRSGGRCSRAGVRSG